MKNLKSKNGNQNIDTVVIDDSRNASNLASVSAASSVTASAFYGDGSNLENTETP